MKEILNNGMVNMVTIPLYEYNELRDNAKELRDDYEYRMDDLRKDDKELREENLRLRKEIKELNRPIEDRYEEAKRELKSAKLKCRLTRGMLFLHEMVSMARHEFAKSKKKDPKTYDYKFPWHG